MCKTLVFLLTAILLFSPVDLSAQKKKILLENHTSVNVNKGTAPIYYTDSLSEMYPDDKFIDKILYLSAQCEEELSNYQNALKLYQEILIKHSNSIFLQQAREKARLLNEKIGELAG